MQGEEWGKYLLSHVGEQVVFAEWLEERVDAGAVPGWNEGIGRRIVCDVGRGLRVILTAARSR